MEFEYVIFSPDGIPTHPTDTYKAEELDKEISAFINRFKDQGYYSSPTHGKIPLDSIHLYINVQPYQNEKETD